MAQRFKVLVTQDGTSCNIQIGVVRQYPQGYKFISHHPHISPSRRYWETPEQAIQSYRRRYDKIWLEQS